MSFPPGMFPAGAAAQSKLTTLSQVASVTSTGQTITVPASVQAGDLLVLWDAAENTGIGSSLPGSVLPAGFTQIFAEAVSQTVSKMRGTASFKIAAGSDAGASLSGQNGDDDRKALYVFRGNKPIAAATPADIASQATTGNPSAQTVNASGQAAPLIVLGFYSSYNGIDPRTFTPAKDGEISAGADSYLAYKIYNLSPADVIVDMDEEDGGVGGNILGSCYIACS